MMCKLMPLRDLWMGEMRAMEVQGRKVLLVHVENAVTAFPDRCLHKAVALSTGRLEGCVLTCSAHEWQYDVRSGAGINPAGVALPRYPVEVRDGEIWIDIDRPLG